MKSMLAGTQEDVVDTTKHGYWMYADGSSYWGIPLLRGHERPIKISKDRHAEQNVEKKLDPTPWLY